MRAGNLVSMRISARTLFLAGIASLALFAPLAARAEQPPIAGRCATTPATAPVMVWPATGSNFVQLQGNWIQMTPDGPQAPAIGAERIALIGGTSYATYGGTLEVDPGNSAFLRAWVPALRANTQYTVDIVLPNAGNCVYATLGTFTTGPSN